MSEVLARSVDIPAEPSVAIAELIRIKGWTDLVPAAPVTFGS